MPIYVDAVRPRGLLRFIDPSPVMDGKHGQSREATRLFDAAQKSGGALRLTVLAKKRWMNCSVGDLRDLADELEHFGLADVTGDRDAPVLVLTDEYKGRILIPGDAPGWDRWAARS